MSTLRRTLGTVEAFGLSLSIIAPTTAMAFVTTLSGQAAGRAVPLTFLIGAVAVALIGLSFVAFGRRVAHAGSVYAYIGQVFGQRWGFVAGWLLLLSYIAFTAGVTALAGDFAAAGLAHAGITFSGLWLLVSVAAAVIGICFAWNDTRIAVRLMLVLEARRPWARRRKTPSARFRWQSSGRSRSLACSTWSSPMPRSWGTASIKCRHWLSPRRRSTNSRPALFPEGSLP
jgi:Amino acid permease